HFNIYRASGDEPMSAAPYRTATGSTFSDQVVDPAETYIYVITAVNVAGVESARSSATYASINPPAPWGVVAAAAPSGGALLSWHYDQPANAARYNVYRSATPSFPLDAAHRIAMAVLPEFADIGASGT